MRCEICGKKIIGKLVRTKIEGSIMLACNECSKFGKIQKEPSMISKSRRVKRRSIVREPAYEVLEDYNVIVREGRERKKWSREDLAERIYEKVSVINRIESGKMVPDIKLARKLELNLNIKLLEKAEELVSEDSGPSIPKRATIGDIAKIRKNK